jgi:hypothetical protein
VDHVRWFYGFAARIPERAIREALTRCGATPEEASGFAAALRARIDQLGVIANAGSAAA